MTNQSHRKRLLKSKDKGRKFVFDNAPYCDANGSNQRALLNECIPLWFRECYKLWRIWKLYAKPKSILGGKLTFCCTSILECLRIFGKVVHCTVIWNYRLGKWVPNDVLRFFSQDDASKQKEKHVMNEWAFLLLGPYPYNSLCFSEFPIPIARYWLMPKAIAEKAQSQEVYGYPIVVSWKR